MILNRAKKIYISLLILATFFAPCLACRNLASGNNNNTESNAQAAAKNDSARNAILNASAVETGERQFFHGNVGERSVTMQLTRSGSNLAGTYYYDGIGKNLTLKGNIDASDNVTLQEFDEHGKQTGKFTGKFAHDEDNDFMYTFSGTWTNPAGGGETNFSLTEQDVKFSNGLRVESRLISDRRRHLRASYPQLVGMNSPGVNAFNQRITAMVTKEVRSFNPESLSMPSGNHVYFDADYVMLLGTDDIISVELTEDFFYGGAHPDIAFQTLTFDLRSGREIQLASLFKPGSNFKTVLQQKSLDELNRRMRQEEAQPGQPQQESPGMSLEELGEINGWAMTRNGLLIYHDLPHVIAALDIAFIPYSELSDILDPNGPAAKFASRSR